ncbi:MAG TPA: hypothetical protein VD906_15025, partial [Caulobacteraceae bacterium]|nr:hypothetical protein [Caulobacteraceae bacterium]
GVIPLSTAEMLKIVKMWDLAKQRIAVAAFSYYLDAVENSAPLYERFKGFVEEVNRRFSDEQNPNSDATPPPEESVSPAAPDVSP